MTPADLQRLMDARGWSDAALADLLGVRRETVWRWRTGTTSIGRRTQLAIEAL